MISFWGIYIYFVEGGCEGRGWGEGGKGGEVNVLSVKKKKEREKIGSSEDNYWILLNILHNSPFFSFFLFCVG